MYRAAMRVIVSELVRQGRLLVTETFSITSHKTTELIKKLRDFDLVETLLVLEEVNEDIYLAARNLPKVDVRDCGA